MSEIPPPATSLAPQASAVPLTSFVGRESEIASVTGLLVRPDVRLLTLTGPGGIGKTRLALQIASAAHEEFADGVVVISLAPILDPDLFPAKLAQVLGVPDAPGQPLLTRLQIFLHDRHMLLVLDNLEHLLDAAASLVVELLPQCHRLTVLGTSRTRLDISWEQVVPLDVLGPDAARQLFTARAQTVMPSFSMTEEHASTVDAICARLDRLPLAIELAASWSTLLPPSALLARLSHRLDVLTGGPRDAPTRQRTMRDAIAWSYDLLSPAEQVLFRSLAVFVGGFTVEAAEAVGGSSTLELLAALTDHSLVSRLAPPNEELRMGLLETIREFALEQLVAHGEETAVRDAHATYFLRMGADASRGMRSHAQLEWFARLQADQDNLRAAITWLTNRDGIQEALTLATDIMWFHWIRGHYTENLTLLESLLAHPKGVMRTVVRAKSLLGIGGPRYRWATWPRLN